MTINPVLGKTTQQNDKILKCFDNGLMTGMIFISLQKVFGTINPGILKHCWFF